MKTLFPKKLRHLSWMLMSLFLLIQTTHAVSRITMDALVNGQPVKLAIDTKSDGATLFAHAADRIGLAWNYPENEGPIAQGRVRAGQTEVCQLDMGAGASQFRFYVVELPDYQRRQLDIDGIISWSNLKGNLLFFDGERQQFSAIETIPEMAKSWQQFSVDAESSSLIFETEGQRVLIHAGSDSGVSLPPENWSNWTEAHPDQPYTLEAISTQANPVSISKLFLEREFNAGALTLENVFVGKLPDSNQGTDEPFDMQLGLQALRGLLVIVDGTQSLCYIASSEHPSALPNYNRLGAIFTPEDIRRSEKLVATVVPGSPANEAGLKDGDQLLKVGKLDVTPWRTQPGILPLGRFWSQPAGTEHSLVLLREGKQIEVVVRLCDIF
jgi:hypothetical protein